MLCVSQLFIKVQIPLVTTCEFHRDTTTPILICDTLIVIKMVLRPNPTTNSHRRDHLLPFLYPINELRHGFDAESGMGVGVFTDEKSMCTFATDEEVSATFL